MSINKILKFSITAIAIVILSYYVDFHQILAVYKNANYIFLSIAFSSIPLLVILRSLKWKILLQAFWKDISFADAFKSYLSGFAYGVLTPGRLGELSRGLFLPYNKMKVGGLVLVDRYLEAVSLVFLVIPGAIYFFGIKIGISLFILNLSLLSIAFIYPRIISAFINNLNFTFLKKIIIIQKDISKISFKIIFLSLIISIMIFIVSISTSYILLRSFTTFDIKNAFLVFPLSLIINIFPITIGNIGLREGANIYLLNYFSVSAEIAFNISIMLFFLHSFLPAIIGFTLVNYFSNESH